MKNLILIRHGETDFTRNGMFCGSSNPSLNYIGSEQAIRISKKLSSEKIDLILSSPLLRCTETASRIFENQDIKVEEQLRECSFGIFEGKTAKECQEMLLAWKIWCDEQFIADAETSKQFQKRIKGVAKDILKINSDTVAIVTHGGVIRLLLSIFLWGNTENQWRIKVETGSIARIEFDGSFAFLKSLNEGK